jgi:hypothetical protein
MVLTVFFALSPVIGLSCHRRRPQCASIVANLTPASRYQDHATSPSTSVAPVLRHQRVHRIPHPTFVTIAIRPSVRGGTAGITKGVSSKRRSEIFLRRGLDKGRASRVVICPSEAGQERPGQRSETYWDSGTVMYGGICALSGSIARRKASMTTVRTFLHDKSALASAVTKASKPRMLSARVKL